MLSGVTGCASKQKDVQRDLTGHQHWSLTGRSGQMSDTSSVHKDHS